ncbi:MAG TPA: polysaccharide ABC transporter ATP-binding protein [Chryseolinea sp.]|nr:polysaccharide ABC transporter ATP-binding protein [Chryseolinea sp.]
MKPILEVHHLAKKYKIRHQSGGYLSLRERMLNAFKPGNTNTEDFWAVNDVSFEVQPGESVGIIGRNGAGKSTLLKILSKITPPTKGKIITRGRIASLLEVGTGFHPELTGRENIFFNGSLLGMKRKEIEEKFDEIVDFSGVEKFLDTPLKHYSSGMQLRLAFSVAAFLEPEILIIDEVLAVGDAEFQKKCLGKMENVSKNGRTILFVSHNMQALSLLCKTGIYLKNGHVESSGEINKTINQYLREKVLLKSFSEFLQSQKPKMPDPDFKLNNIIFYQDKKEVFENIDNGKEVKIELHYELFNRLNRFRVFLDVCDHFGTVIFRTFHDEDDSEKLNLDRGIYISSLTLPANILAPISYDFKFQFGLHNVRMMEPEEGISLRINVDHTGLYNLTYNGQYTAGMISPVMKWEINKIKN